MSEYTDYMIESFFSHAVDLRERINDSEKWIRAYLSQRKNYPEWVTKEGVRIKIGDITDSHLNNLLNFVPENSVWHKAFTYEKKYRYLKKNLPIWKAGTITNDEIIDVVF